MSLQEEVKISDDNTWLWLKLKFPMNSRIVISMRPCLKNSDLSHNVATLLQAHREDNKTSAYSTTDDKVSSYPYSTHLTSSIQLQQHSSTVGLQSHKSKESQKLMAAQFHEHFFHYKRKKKKTHRKREKKQPQKITLELRQLLSTHQNGNDSKVGFCFQFQPSDSAKDTQVSELIINGNSL